MRSGVTADNNAGLRAILVDIAKAAGSHRWKVGERDPWQLHAIAPRSDLPHSLNQQRDGSLEEGNLLRRVRAPRPPVELPSCRAGERVVPLFPSARRVLAERKLRAHPYDGPEDFVFVTKLGTAVDPNNFVKREFGRQSPEPASLRSRGIRCATTRCPR